ncbi:MAG: hypothetical protein MUF10_16520 [Thermoanaerobaculaceae bacterium]|nr:hypothetical protein [Thermoanaerobaculaceae bacterium]
MKRFFAVLALVTLVAMPALAEDHAGCMKSKGMQRTVANIDNGVTITMTCSDSKMVPEVQAKAAKGCGGECPMAATGVTRTVANTPEGAVVTATSTDPAQVKALQEHAAKGCAGEHAKAGCKHDEAAKAGCAHGDAAKEQTSSSKS